MVKRILSLLIIISSITVSAVYAQQSNTSDARLPSDGRFNFNVRDDVKGLEFILKLKPVTYQLDIKKLERLINGSNIFQTVWKSGEARALRIRRTGFIAQEVEHAAKEVQFDFNGIKKPAGENDYYSLNYESFVVPLVQAVQEQQMLLRVQERTIELQEERIKLLEDELKKVWEEVRKK